MQKPTSKKNGYIAKAVKTIPQDIIKSKISAIIYQSSFGYISAEMAVLDFLTQVYQTVDDVVELKVPKLNSIGAILIAIMQDSDNIESPIGKKIIHQITNKPKEEKNKIIQDMFNSWFKYLTKSEFEPEGYIDWATLHNILTKNDPDIFKTANYLLKNKTSVASIFLHDIVNKQARTYSDFKFTTESVITNKNLTYLNFKDKKEIFSNYSISLPLIESWFYNSTWGRYDNNKSTLNTFKPLIDNIRNYSEEEKTQIFSDYINFLKTNKTKINNSFSLLTQPIALLQPSNIKTFVSSNFELIHSLLEYVGCHDYMTIMGLTHLKEHTPEEKAILDFAYETLNQLTPQDKYDFFGRIISQGISIDFLKTKTVLNMKDSSVDDLFNNTTNMLGYFDVKWSNINSKYCDQSEKTNTQFAKFISLMQKEIISLKHQKLTPSKGVKI